jgi:hypothetical protein
VCLVCAWLAWPTAQAWAAPVEPPGAAPSGGSTGRDQLVLPDLQTLAPIDVRIQRLAGGQRLLRLGNTVWNSGAGPLALSGTFNPGTQRTLVTQYYPTRTGPEQSQPVGEFIWHPGHDHFHFEGFASYELWTITPRAGLGALAASGGKISYCLIDHRVVDVETPGFEDDRNYWGCGRARQGLSPGWGDRYDAFLDGQFVDITNVADGLYALVSTVNPDRRLLEADYTNNAARLYLDISGMSVTVISRGEAANRWEAMQER